MKMQKKISLSLQFLKLLHSLKKNSTKVTKIYSQGTSRPFIFILCNKEMILSLAHDVSGCCCWKVNWRLPETSYEVCSHVHLKLHLAISPEGKNSEHVTSPSLPSYHKCNDEWSTHTHTVQTLCVLLQSYLWAFARCVPVCSLQFSLKKVFTWQSFI